MADNSRYEDQVREDEAVIAGLTPAQQAAMLRHAARLAYDTPRTVDAPSGDAGVWVRGVMDAASALIETSYEMERDAYGPPRPEEPPAPAPGRARIRAREAQRCDVVAAADLPDWAQKIVAQIHH